MKRRKKLRKKSQRLKRKSKPKRSFHLKTISTCAHHLFSAVDAVVVKDVVKAAEEDVVKAVDVAEVEEEATTTTTTTTLLKPEPLKVNNNLLKPVIKPLPNRTRNKDLLVEEVDVVVERDAEAVVVVKVAVKDVERDAVAVVVVKVAVIVEIVDTVVVVTPMVVDKDEAEREEDVLTSTLQTLVISLILEHSN